MDTTRNSLMPRSRVTLLMTSKQWATTAEFSGVISPQEAMWALGITRKWVGPGACHYCPKGHAHSLQNTGPLPLEFFAVVPEEP